MKIVANAVVSIEYVLRDDQGDVIDSSEGDEPLAYIHGHEQIVPGLENALAGRIKGDAVDAVIAPKDGYGDHDDELIIRITRDELPPEMVPEVGMEIGAEDEDGEQMYMITEINGPELTLDGNHPLAGKTLHFAVKIVDVRMASKEELLHGHVHGSGGHHH
jgi:FKBP-type peptidyl-prolyl cis-trans isomerase SlyD